MTIVSAENAVGATRTLSKEAQDFYAQLAHSRGWRGTQSRVVECFRRSGRSENNLWRMARFPQDTYSRLRSNIKSIIATGRQYAL